MSITAPLTLMNKTDDGHHLKINLRYNTPGLPSRVVMERGLCAGNESHFLKGFSVGNPDAELSSLFVI
jgi:hypothetical protein